MHRTSGRSVSGRMSTTPQIEPMVNKISSVRGAGRHAAVALAYLSPRLQPQSRELCAPRSVRLEQISGDPHTLNITNNAPSDPMTNFACTTSVLSSSRSGCSKMTYNCPVIASGVHARGGKAHCVHIGMGILQVPHTIRQSDRRGHSGSFDRQAFRFHRVEEYTLNSALMECCLSYVLVASR